MLNVQVEDLAVASPATVSRAGMIFLDVDEMGWQPFVNSWLQQRYLHTCQHTTSGGGGIVILDMYNHVS